MDNIKTCDVKSPKNYYIVRFVLSLVRHAGEGILSLECVPKIVDGNECFKVGYLIVFFLEQVFDYILNLGTSELIVETVSRTVFVL